MSEIFDHRYRKLIVRDSASRKTNAFFNLINLELDIDQFYFCTKDPNEAKYQLLINKRKNTGFKYFNDSKAILNIQKIWMTFIKILKNAIQIRNQN